MSEVIAKLFSRMFGLSDAVSRQPSAFAGDDIAKLQPVLSGSERLYNREISDLRFIQRVAEEAANPNHPLFERLRFLTIAADVLDQFYAVRVAKMKRSVARKDGYVTADGLTPAQQLKAVTFEANELMISLQGGWDDLKEELANHNIFFPMPEALSERDREWMSRYFRTHFMHVLTPFTIDEEHPFPFIGSGGLCVILEFRRGRIVMPLPHNLPRFVSLPGEHRRFISSELLIQCCWQDMFPDEELRNFGVFQILRDNDLAKEEMNDDLRAIVESGLRSRHKANVTKLSVSESMSDDSIRFVTEHLGLMNREELLTLAHRNMDFTETEFIFSARLVGLSNLSEILGELGENYPGFMFPAHKPRYPETLTRFENDVFAALQVQDLLVHWPFESFDSVVRFLDQAANDPDVVAIKQTVYRTNDESPIVESLITAAQNGKTVLAVVELEARDNEESNIQLAKRMEAAGVQIVYGIIGLKIHCKATLVVRMEDDEAITYTHLGTGNYHPANAKIYTDLSFFTRDEVIGYDAHLVFSYLTSERMGEPTKLIVAPYYLRQQLNDLIDQEIFHVRAGRPGYICIKVNSLTDPEIIERLYAASESGVDIDLIVRRHCMLVPGVPGMSSRIRVKSIVGRFLEHSRIYMFGNGMPISAEGAAIYFGSADLMERNLDARAEILVPVESRPVRETLIDGIMHANVKDSRQSWILNDKNEYVRHRADDGFSAHEFFMETDSPASLGQFSSPGRWDTNEGKLSSGN